MFAAPSFPYFASETRLPEPLFDLADYCDNDGPDERYYEQKEEMARNAECDEECAPSAQNRSEA